MASSKVGVRLMYLELLAATWKEEAFGLVRATVWFALIFLLLAGAIHLVKRYRETGSLLGRWGGRTKEDPDNPGELLTKFRDLHTRGTLSDGEYRTIKTKLASQIRSDLRPSSDTTGGEEDSRE